MQVQAQARTPLAKRRKPRRQNAIQIGIAFENRAEAIFHHHRHAQIGPRAL